MQYMHNNKAAGTILLFIVSFSLRCFLQVRLRGVTVMDAYCILQSVYMQELSFKYL